MTKQKPWTLADAIRLMSRRAVLAVHDHIEVVVGDPEAMNALAERMDEIDERPAGEE